ncbi:MAG: serine/threonine protein kinase [Cyanobacteriota bacterium]|nr:serine/threonine protein kinase [Cyanobacteriota bacterium]
MTTSAGLPSPGTLIAERYRLEQQLSSSEQGNLWRGSDLLAGEAAVALRQLGPPIDLQQARQRWAQLQGVLHPQVPRLGAAIAAADQLWLVREWQVGRTYDQLRTARLERQLVFGAGEVVLLLRQLLPVLAVLHSQELVHGDLSPANLLRRDSDGLPVLLDFGQVCGMPAATAGFAPPELARSGVPQAWMDLHAAGVMALVLVSGLEPAALLDPVTLAWRWPAALEAEPELQGLLQRLLSTSPAERFASATQAFKAFQALPMPESTGPVPRADRTVVLVPPSPEPDAAAAPAPEPQPAAGPAASPELPAIASQPEPQPLPQTKPARSRAEEREEAVEGGVWPVVIALVLSAVVGTALGWWFLSRGRLALPTSDSALQLPNSLPPVEVDQRQNLLNRLRAMQVDRPWFLKLVDASLLAQFPERGGRLPSDSADDAPLRKVWNELAEEWLAKVEQLPLEIRRRLGSYSMGDWQQRQQSLVVQGLSPAVLRQLVSGSARTLLPGREAGEIPPEPFRQLWFAAAEQSLANVQIEPIDAQPLETKVLSAQVDAAGARLFPIRLPAGYRLVLGVNGSPLMQMAVYAADGAALEARGPLRVVSLGPQRRSPVQLLVNNEGVAPALITLSLRADPAVAAPRPQPSAATEPATPPAAPFAPPPLDPPAPQP